MKLIILFFPFIILIGCTNTPAPQDEKDIHAKSTIAQNINEAQKAQDEYLALQEKRRREGPL